MDTRRSTIALLLCALPLMAQTWEPRADMPTPRYDAGSVLLDGKVYVIGGRVETETALSAVEAYDPRTDSWARMADMPTQRGRVAVAAFNGQIYVFGGVVGGETAVVPMSIVEVFDPVANRWASAAPMPYKSQGLKAEVVDNRIYLTGGMSWPDFQGTWEYDPTTDTWTQHADLPSPRTLHASGLIQNRIFAVGGGIQGAWGARSLWAYDLATDVWTRGENMPTGRVALLGAIDDGQLYAIGGEVGAPGGLTVVEKYDPETNTWTTGPSLTTGRSFLSGAVVDGTILAIGGRDAARLPTGSVEALQLRSPTTAVQSTTWGTVKAGDRVIDEATSR
jgi:N-acetylneuraminic acid mutarotase